MFWQQISGSDGVTRHLQWQARVEGKTNSKRADAITRRNADGPPASMTITQYVGTGSTSRGRMAITPALTTRVSIAPYLRKAADKEAVVQGIEYIRNVLSQIHNLTWIAPPMNQSTTTFVNSVCLLRRLSRSTCADSSSQIPATPGSRGSNHWTGSCTLGTDDGRLGGKAVVDLDTKVYGVSSSQTFEQRVLTFVNYRLTICSLSMRRFSQV